MQRQHNNNKPTTTTTITLAMRPPPPLPTPTPTPTNHTMSSPSSAPSSSSSPPSPSLSLSPSPSPSSPAPAPQTPSPSQTPTTSLAVPSCEVCRCKSHLLRCAGCQAVYYCGRDHQAADRASHRKPCSATKRARVHLCDEEQKLRAMPGDWSLPAHVFENGVGLFWSIMATRPYMRARFQLVDRLLQGFGLAGGRAAVVETCLDHLLDMIRLCRSDNMGVRDLVPALYIRLGRDQDAYDFAKWYANAGEQDTYDWDDVELPFLDIKGADVLEEPACWAREWIALSHAVAVVLTKVRVLLDLMAMQNASRALLKTLPQEIIQLIRVQLVDSALISRPGLLIASADEVARLIETVKAQLKHLHRSIKNYNPDFWPSLLVNSTTALNSRPQHYSPGSLEEAYLVIGYNYASWAETPGALEIAKAVDQAAEV